jgi:SOS response regulatory protein OraA/RecX
MKITSIKQQIKRADRYSIFVDGKYVFSLSESALLQSKLASGQELTSQQISDYKRLSAEDKLYNQALRYAAMRPRSEWEVEFYLERKGASPEAIDKALGDERQPEQDALLSIIATKRRQTKYQDDLKLMQYLARQGFNYDDIKSALDAKP